MLNKLRVLAAVMLTLGFSIFTGCDSDDPVAPNSNFDYKTILTDYAEKVVVATYSNLHTKSNALLNAVKTFRTTSTQTNLNLAADAWVATRAPWESSEAFLFGPAANASIDPSLDSWPLDQNQLQNVLNSNFELTADFVHEGLGVSVRGFHTIEFLLFKDGNPRHVADVTEREKEYLVAVAEVLVRDTEVLYHGWDKGIDGAQPYKNEFINAGKSGSRYVSQEAAIQEIIGGIIGIADEVGTGKIAGPYGTKEVLEVESWFSWNSLTDFKNNINSIKNAYNGVDKGLSSYIKEKDSALNTRVNSEIQAAYEAIDAIPEPFRNNLNASSQIEAAIAACAKIVKTFEDDIKPVVEGK